MKMENCHPLNLVKSKNGKYKYVFVKGKPGEDDRLINYLLTNNNKSYNARAKKKAKSNNMGEEEQSGENCLTTERMNTTIDDPQQTIHLLVQPSTRREMDTSIIEKENELANLHQTILSQRKVLENIRESHIVEINKLFVTINEQSEIINKKQNYVEVLEKQNIIVNTEYNHLRGIRQQNGGSR